MNVYSDAMEVSGGESDLTLEDYDSEATSSSFDSFNELAGSFDSRQSLTPMNCKREEEPKAQPFSFQEDREDMEGVMNALSKLPWRRRQALDQVLREDPRLVQLESPPERYLLACNDDENAAADCIADYWESRKEIFGTEHFCRPMTLTGDGALDATAVQAIQNGAMILPPDKRGRPVLLVDREKMNESAWGSTNIRSQVYFYLFQVLSESELAIQNGFVGIFAIETEHTQERMKVEPFGDALKLVQIGIMPINPRAIHVFAMRKPFSSKRASCSFREWDLHIHDIRLVSHLCATKDEAMRNLKSYGFSDRHITARFGGRANPRTWYQNRLRLEQQRYECLKNETMETSPTNKELVVATPSTTDADSSRGLKRKIEEMKDWACEQAEQRKVAKLLQEQESLQKEQKLLQAQAVCGSAMAHQYEKDRVVIHAFLTQAIARILAPMTELFPPEVRDDPGKHEALADTFLADYMMFQGRAPTTGQWIFQITDKPQPQDIFAELLRLRLDLHNLQQIVDNDNLMENLQKMQPPISQEVSNANEGDEDHEDEDVQLAALQAQVSQLEAQSKSLKRQESLLESLKVCADHEMEQHHLDRVEIRGELTKMISGLTPWNPTVGNLVGHLLAHYIIYLGRGFKPTGVTESTKGGSNTKALYSFTPNLILQLRQFALEQELARSRQEKKEEERKKLWHQARNQRKRALKRL